MQQAVMDVVGQHFRPEFINRLDETVVFQPLGREQTKQITVLQIERLQKRLHSKQLGLQVTLAAINYLAQVGYDVVYGARPLKRTIQRLLENPLAQDILAGKYLPGDIITVDKKKDQLVFAKK